ncbi:MAG: hypothetical protein JSW43_02515 [Gemmatimonadota bacterium]|nr:MAG: hypothetical protein JSW43_02515 [Gemmatimonadota bacterium]
MNRRTMIVLLTAALATAACSDATGPPTEPTAVQEMAVPDGALHSLHWAGTEGPLEFTIEALPDDEGPSDGGDIVIAEAPAAGEARLDRYEVSFWAVKGRSRSVQINYRDDHGVRPFLRFDVPRYALLRHPDGSRIAWGEAVRITVKVDRTRIAAFFAPSGLAFSRWDRPWLRIWYGGADWDFNGDGVIDEQDQEIEQRRLRLWFQDEPGAPWYPLRAWHSLRGKWFAAPLDHFSGGQVSF